MRRALQSHGSSESVLSSQRKLVGARGRQESPPDARGWILREVRRRIEPAHSCAGRANRQRDPRAIFSQAKQDLFVSWWTIRLANKLFRQELRFRAPGGKCL